MIQKPVIFNGAIMFHRERLPESGQTKGIYQQCAYNVVSSHCGVFGPANCGSRISELASKIPVVLEMQSAQRLIAHRMKSVNGC
jgi:hypothetical protein